MTEEQTKLFYDKHYEQLQKQWKEHADRIVSTAPAASAEETQKKSVSAVKEYLENIVTNNRVSFSFKI